MARHILSKSEVAALFPRDDAPFREVRFETEFLGTSEDGAEVHKLSETVLRRIVDAI